jgi:hypothetical protein
MGAPRCAAPPPHGLWVSGTYRFVPIPGHPRRRHEHLLGPVRFGQADRSKNFHLGIVDFDDPILVVLFDSFCTETAATKHAHR